MTLQRFFADVIKPVRPVAVHGREGESFRYVRRSKPCGQVGEVFPGMMPDDRSFREFEGPVRVVFPLVFPVSFRVPFVRVDQEIVDVEDPARFEHPRYFPHEPYSVPNLERCRSAQRRGSRRRKLRPRTEGPLAPLPEGPGRDGASRPDRSFFSKNRRRSGRYIRVPVARSTCGRTRTRRPARTCLGTRTARNPQAETVS